MTGLRRASLFLSQHSFPFLQAFQTKQRFDIIIIRINNRSIYFRMRRPVSRAMKQESGIALTTLITVRA